MDLSSLLVAFVVIIIILLLSNIAGNYFKSRSNVPKPPGNWLFGHAFEIKKSKDAIQLLTKWIITYGPIVQFQPLGIFDETYYLVADADALKQILVSNSFKYERPKPDSEQWHSKNVLMANGKEHARMRKMMNPVFKVNKLKSMLSILKEKADILGKYWEDAIDAKPRDNFADDCNAINVQNDILRMGLDVLGPSVFGQEFNTIEYGDSELSNSFKALTKGVNFGVSNVQRKITTWFPFLLHLRTSKKLSLIYNFVKQIIEEKKRNQSTDQKKDLLSLLLDATDEETGQGMDERELFSQTYIFLFAGHETTSISLSWILYFLAQYPRVQEKLREEVANVLNEEEASWETYESMKYLSAVINETLRIRPVAAVYRRRAKKDDEILGYKIPAGSLIIIPIYALHHRPEYWKDPETFNPERFLNEGVQDNRFAFLPFSTGPRTCIGYRFALIEMKVALSTLIKRFSFSIIPGTSYEAAMSATYKPNPSLRLLVKKIT